MKPTPSIRLVLAAVLFPLCAVGGDDSIALFFPTNGICHALYVEEGERVDAGARLAALTTTQKKQAVKDAARTLRAAHAEVETARRAFLHAVKQGQNDRGDRRGIERAREALERAIEKQARARQAHRKAESAARPTLLRAPAPGIIARVHLLPGELVLTNQPAITLTPGTP